MMNVMPNAKHGTILSVIEKSIEDLVATKLQPGETWNVHQLVTHWQSAAQQELERTPDQLEVNGKFVLKERNVVDSGAQGFVYLLDGMALALKGELTYGNYLSRNRIRNEEEEAMNANKNSAVKDSEVRSADDLSGIKEEDVAFRYCTEFIVQLRPGESKDDLVAAIQPFGDSIVPLFDEVSGLVKVHIHTNEPSTLFKLVADQFLDQKHGMSTGTSKKKKKVRAKVYMRVIFFFIDYY